MKVAVLVDLEFSQKAGGHVKFWQRISEAISQKDNVNLTVFFLGEKKNKNLGDKKYKIFTYETYSFFKGLESYWC